MHHALFRVSDDEKMAVRLPGAAGDHGGYHAYATEALIAEAARTLAIKANISISAKPNLGESIITTQGKKVTLAKIEATNKAEGHNVDESGRASFPNDCGMCAHEATGAYAEGKMLLARSLSVTTDGAKVFGIPAAQKALLFEANLHHLLSPEEQAAAETRKQEFAGFQARLNANPPTDPNLLDQETRAATQLAEEWAKVYTNYLFTLPTEERAELAKQMKIDEFASYDVGDALVISTGGHDRSYEGRFNGWNYHWSTVIMSSGSDYMTLENFRDGDFEPGTRTPNWLFQMYGSKKGQSFHEDQRDRLRDYGENPTTMHMIKTAPNPSSDPE
jgi:hypothetical protein